MKTSRTVDEQPLDAIFSPKNVAVIGASEREGSVGRTILRNLISTPFGGAVFPINPKRPSVLGIKAYPSIADVPEQVDLAVIITPAQTVPQLVDDCGKAGVRGLIIISAGFKEVGAQGVELEHQILERGRHYGMRIIGPNCLGVMSPVTGLNATFASVMARPGKVGFISQSGALCTAILDWSLQQHVGFSHFVSHGSMLDVDWGDLIYYMGDDPRTESIVLYMETIGNARSFLSAAREVALTKPIIVIKAGRTEAAAKAAASHTGSLAGSDEVLDAAFRRCGVLRVDTIAHLFYMAEILAQQPRPKGPRLTIMTNAGGPGVLATDALITEGGELATISENTMEDLNKFLPPHWSHGNPIDILGDADPERYVQALDVAAQDPNSDGLLVILTPQSMTDPTQTAEHLKSRASSYDKPILASWMGGSDVAAGAAILKRNNIPTFPYPDTAARMFHYMWRYSYNQQALYETPVLPSVPAEHVDEAAIREPFDRARLSGRTILTEYESKRLLQAYGISTVETRLASTADEAVSCAEAIGYPVVLKLNSETITHKTDVGGVRLNLANAEEVRGAFKGIEETLREREGEGHFDGVTVQPMVKLEGYEIIVGSSLDPQFGPVLLFGSGGQLVEVYKDRALGLPPLNSTLARRMMEQTRIYKALQGVRGRKGVDMRALEDLLIRFSQLVAEQRAIKEIDINPLLASSDQILALDARVLLHEPDVAPEKLPNLAIRPYPSQYTWNWTASDGTQAVIRPIRPEDEPLIAEFHTHLSDKSVLARYTQPIPLTQRVAHERLAQVCCIDYDREFTLVVEYQPEGSAAPRIIAAARLQKEHGLRKGFLRSIIVCDEFQHRGIGKELMRRILEIADAEKLDSVRINVPGDNDEMQRLCKDFDFDMVPLENENLVHAERLVKA